VYVIHRGAVLHLYSILSDLHGSLIGDWTITTKKPE
jgi:hypothetical protein